MGFMSAVAQLVAVPLDVPANGHTTSVHSGVLSEADTAERNARSDPVVGETPTSTHKSYSPTLARRTDPETSVKAAERAFSFKPHHEGRIYGALCSTTAGLTIYDIARITGLDHVAVARRMKSLEERRLVKREIVRYSESGRLVYESRDGCALWWRTQ